MASRNEIIALLARLTAAYPSFRVPTATAELWIQKLEPCHPHDASRAIESFIERGGRAPCVGDVLSKAKELAQVRAMYSSGQPYRVPIGVRTTADMSREERHATWDRNFEVGRARALERFAEAEADHETWKSEHFSRESASL